MRLEQVNTYNRCSLEKERQILVRTQCFRAFWQVERSPLGWWFRWINAVMMDNEEDKRSDITCLLDDVMPRNAKTVV